MRRPELKRAWYASPYTGLFTESGPTPREAYDAAWRAVAGINRCCCAVCRRRSNGMPSWRRLGPLSARRDRARMMRVNDTEDVPRLVERLGAEQPCCSQPDASAGLATERLDWLVLRVVVPGLQPLHVIIDCPSWAAPCGAPRRLEGTGLT